MAAWRDTSWLTTISRRHVPMPVTELPRTTELPTGIFAGSGCPTLVAARPSQAWSPRARRSPQPAAPGQSEHGAILDATDNRSAAFAVLKPSPCRKRPELNRCRLSETANVSYEVADSDVIRDFYATCWGGPSNRAASRMAGRRRACI